MSLVYRVVIGLETESGIWENVISDDMWSQPLENQSFYFIVLRIEKAADLSAYNRKGCLSFCWALQIV